jgi:hypothetical protein
LAACSGTRCGAMLAVAGLAASLALLAGAALRAP